MTKREALLIMLEMWDYISINGVIKYDTIKALGLPQMLNSCSCCEYDSQHKDDCSACPICWPTSASCYHNECDASYYSEWQSISSGTETAMYLARKIANLALDALNKAYPEEY